MLSDYVREFLGHDIRAWFDEVFPNSYFARARTGYAFQLSLPQFLSKTLNPYA